MGKVSFLRWRRSRPLRRQPCHSDPRSPLLQMLGRLHERGDSRRARSIHPQARDGLGREDEGRPKSGSPNPQHLRHALYGLALPASVLRALQKRGIYCTPGVSLEHQHLAKRYVLRGVESGGAVSDMGRACAFVAPDGRRLRGCSPSTRSPSMAVMPSFLRKAWYAGDAAQRADLRTGDYAPHRVACAGAQTPGDCLEAAVSRTGRCAPIRSLEGGTPRTPGKVDSHLL